MNQLEFELRTSTRYQPLQSNYKTTHYKLWAKLFDNTCASKIRSSDGPTELGLVNQSSVWYDGELGCNQIWDLVGVAQPFRGGQRIFDVFFRPQELSQTDDLIDHFISEHLFCFAH